MPSATTSAQAPLQTIATLRCDDEVDGVFACTRKERKISRGGAPYLTLELRDSTGSMRARGFRDADVLAGRFQRGELVHVRGRVERFRDELQIELRSIVSAVGADADPARFLPVAYRDLDELEGFFEHLCREVYDSGLSALLQRMLSDGELRRELRRAPCSIPTQPGGVRGGGHHAYLGGLLEHTVAVGTLALELCTLHPRLDRDLLLCAALVHDIGKTREFTYGAEIARSEEGRLLGHVQLGLRIISAHGPPGLADARRMALEHCVLLHHGADAAAGQRTASPEALALARLNSLDAQLKGAFEHGGALTG